jgi:hypothetical protein
MNLLSLYLIITIFVRNPQRNNKSFLALLPKVPGYPHIAIILDKVENSILKKGVKGIHPLDCLPLWGRVVVTLIITSEKYPKTKKNEGSVTAIFENLVAPPNNYHVLL